MKILNIGSLNLDYVYQVDHMVCGGETISSDGMEVYLGGKGFNQSVALANAGVEVYHAGIVGTEGEVFFDACLRYGIRSSYIKRGSMRNGHTIIQIDKAGQNAIMLYGGCNRAFSKEYINDVLDGFEPGDYLILQNEVNLLDYIIDRAYEKGLIIVLNPSPYDAYLDACKLEKISFFVLNEIEGFQMSGKTKEDEILSKMEEMFPQAGVLLTLGKRGAIYAKEGKRWKQEIYDSPVVDTTAAGDTFTGYFVASLIKMVPVEEALKMSTMASAIAVSRKGAAPSIPTSEEVMSELGKQILNAKGGTKYETITNQSGH